MGALLVKSLNLGVIDSALNWLIAALTTLLQWLVNFTLDLVVTLLSGILYAIGLTLLSIVDFFQAFFNALCGLGSYYPDTMAKNPVKGDPVLALITNHTVLDVFLAMFILALIMLILATIVAIIRTEYTTEGAKNTKGNIIGSAIKSLAMFVVVPASCVFGILLSSALLKSVYAATTGGSNVSAGAMIWYASSYNANLVRLNKVGRTIPKNITFYDDHWGSKASDNDIYAADFKIQSTSTNHREDVANAIDLAFKNETEIKNGPKKFASDAWQLGPTLGDMAFNNGDAGIDKSKKYYSYRDIDIVDDYYEIREMSFIILFLGAGIAVGIFFYAAFGMILRMYKCAILFMISPPLVALTPLDGGGAFKNWKKLMIGSVASTFSVVVAFNLSFLLIPIVGNIRIFPITGPLQTWNRMVQLIFMLTGLYSLKETSKWVSNLLGLEDPLAAGSEIAGKVMGTVSKIGMTAGTAGVAMGANVIKTGQNLRNKSLKSKRDNATTKADYDKYNEKLQKGKARSEGIGKFESKMSGVGAGIIGKHVKGLAGNLESVTGGTEIFKNLGESAAGKVSNLYQGSLKIGGTVIGAISGGKEEAKDYREHRERQQRITALEGQATRDRAEEAELKSLKETEANFSQTHKGGDGKWGRVRNFVTQYAASHANSTDKTNQELQHEEDVDAANSQAVKMAEDSEKQANLDLDQLIAMRSIFGSSADAQNSKNYMDAVEELARKFGSTIQEVVEALDKNKPDDPTTPPDASKINELRDKAHEPLNIISQSRNQITGKISIENITSPEDKEIFMKLMKQNGIDGVDPVDAIKAIEKNLKEELSKKQEEIAKESKKIQELASAIAKSLKKVLPKK